MHTYCMDYEFKEKQLPSQKKQLETTFAQQTALATPQISRTEQKPLIANALAKKMAAPLQVQSHDPAQLEKAHFAQIVQEKRELCASKSLSEQVQMIEQMQTSLESAKTRVAELKNLCSQAKSSNFSLESEMGAREHAIEILKEEIKVCSNTCVQSIQIQLENCQDTDSKQALIKTLNTIRAKFQDYIEAEDIVKSCESALVTLQESTSVAPQKSTIASAVQAVQGDQIQIDEQQVIQTFRNTLTQKLGSCKTLQAEVDLVFELFALQEQLVQQKVPEAIIEACHATINLCALNIRRELSDLPQSRPSWFYDKFSSKVTGNKHIEHTWQKFTTTVHHIKKGFDELIKNHGAVPASRIEHLRQATEACQSLEVCINDLCHFGLDRVSSQDTGLTRKECHELISTSKKLSGIAEIFTKNMQAIPEAPQKQPASSYHEARTIVQQEPQAAPTVAHHGRTALGGFMGSILGCAFLKYCGISATIGVTWGAGVALTGGISLVVGGAVLAGIAIKQRLDRPAQTEIHMRTPVTGPQMYKIGPLKTDLTESVSSYIRHQHVLQQDLTQPIYSDNPAPQARSTTFTPLETTQRQAAPVQTATDSVLILDQATARIPVQYDARATTQGGSVSVDMVSAEELKQNLIAAERYFTEQAYQQKALGNIEHAANLIGIRDTLHTIYLLSLQAADLAYPSQNPANQIAKATIGGLAGAVKGGADFVQGTQQLICHPQQTIQELENAVKRLDYFIFSLCSDNPQARDELRAGIQQFWDAPIEKKAELATRILVGFKVAPELLGKGIGKIIDAVKEAAIIEKARELTGTIGKGIAETATDSKIAEAPVAVTPEGAMIPAELDISTAVLMEAEKPVQGQTTNLGVISDGKDPLDLAMAESKVNQNSTAILRNGYYEVNGFKISEYYYNKLWNAGRPAPTLFAKEILDVAKNITPDIKPGFFRYEGLGWELVYNPTTKEIWHIQPI